MLGKNRLRELQQLHQKKFREEQKMFLAEGAKIVPELLQSEFPVKEVFALDFWLTNNHALIQMAGCKATEITQQELEKLSQLQSPQEVIALCETPQQKLNDLKSGQLALLLDSIRDPGNMGTLLRLADWFGLDAVYATNDCVEWTNPKVIQATMGSFIRIQPIYVDAEVLLSPLKGKFPVYAADLDGENLYTSTYTAEGILIISNEAHGLNPILENYLSGKIHIPAFPRNGKQPESLNAAMAGAIVLGEFSRRRLLTRNQEKA